MNVKALSDVEQMLAELSAAVHEDMATFSSHELLEFAHAHIDQSNAVLLENLRKGSQRTTTLAAVTLYRLVLERCEAKAMEAT